VVGASAGSDLRLDVNEVSSRHAVLEVSPAGEVFVLDQGSTNGTFLEGQRLSPGQRVPWKPGQMVSFSTKVEVRLEAR
jgi:pSer/pThr/pTyr-binding forkhead associated (FHA) protein